MSSTPPTASPQARPVAPDAPLRPPLKKRKVLGPAATGASTLASLEGDEFMLDGPPKIVVVDTSAGAGTKPQPSEPKGVVAS